MYRPHIQDAKNKLTKKARVSDSIMIGGEEVRRENHVAQMMGLSGNCHRGHGEAAVTQLKNI